MALRLRTTAGLERHSPQLFEIVVMPVVSGPGESQSGDEEKRIHRQNLPRRQ